ncbi:MAG TPA: alpha/beta family hydrolase [Streptosporangiaceae bacterium]
MGGAESGSGRGGQSAGGEIGTSQGPARVELQGPAGAVAPAFLLALTHGAAGTVGAPDLLAVREVALRLGGAVALITQPYRVRGARAPGNASRQDEAWQEIIRSLRISGIPLIQGGRSNGARVACRTASAVGAIGVLALAFPLRPPGRHVAAGGSKPPGGPESADGPGPAVTRAEELLQAVRGGANVLVVNGDRDPFGVPAADEATRVVVLKGETHSLSRNPAAVSEAVAGWLSDLLPDVR